MNECWRQLKCIYQNVNDSPMRCDAGEALDNNEKIRKSN